MLDGTDVSFAFGLASRYTADVGDVVDLEKSAFVSLNQCKHFCKIAIDPQ